MALGQQPRKPIATTGEPPNAPMQRGRGFLHEVMAELKKTTWPTLPEAWRLTTVVLGVIVAMAVYVGVIDAALSFITNRFHLIK